MSKICQITGKTSQVGNNVSHSKKRTKRTFEVNLLNKKLFLEDEDRWVNLRVSASGLRVINKVGLRKALEDAKRKGFIKSY
jgi:large subunit ribosomal protein L28